MVESEKLQLWLQRWQQIMVWLVQSSILFIFAVATAYWRPNWLKSSNVPGVISDGLSAPTSSAAYQTVSFARYAISLFIFFLVVFWLLSGLHGWRNILKPFRLLWLAAFGLLLGWVWLSVGWSAENIAVARSQAWQWTLVYLFVLMVLAVGPSARWITAALVAGMLFQAVIGITQTLMQRDLGINWIDDNLLGIGIGIFEFPLDPAVSGISVIQTENIRFLRAYGVTPHPNLMAAGLVFALIGSLWMWHKLDRRVVVTVSTVGIWALFLTFSRASAGGLFVGTAATIIIWTLSRRPHLQSIIAFGITIISLAAVFYVLYQPLINVRAGVGDEGQNSLETISTASRDIFERQAQDIIAENTLQGIGIGNFPWVSHEMLRDTPQYEIRGNNVHHVYYLATAELGVIGLSLVGVLALLTTYYVFYARLSLSLAALSLCGGLVAWLAIGFFEFFFWSLLPYQILFWGTIAVILKDQDNAEN